MNDLPPYTHAEILRNIRDLQTNVRVLRDSTHVKNGYMGFELTGSILAELHTAISKNRDRDQIIEWLKRADKAIALTGAGDVAPAVELARASFQAMMEELENPAGLT